MTFLWLRSIILFVFLCFTANTLLQAATCTSSIICAVPGVCIWDDATSWDCGVVPQDGDDVIIDTGHEVEVDNNVYPSARPLLIITVKGNLLFTNGKLRLDVNSVITIEDGGSIAPSPPVNNNQIEIGAGAPEWSGGDGTVNGPHEITDGSSTPLPVELIYFKGKEIEGGVQLDWATASELNSDFFTLLRSTDAYSFSEVALIEAQGFSYNTVVYTYFDESPPGEGIVYYQLRETDLDGTSETFKMILVKFRIDDLNLTLYPNPVKSGELLTLKLNFDPPLGSVVRFYSNIGTEVIDHIIDNKESIIRIPDFLKVGAYFIEFIGTGIFISERIIIIP